MAKIGKISVIPKDFEGAFPTMEKSLRTKGMSRSPGTMRFLFPYKDLNGKYRTGLDEYAKSVLAIEDEELRKLEQARIRDTRKRLEEISGFDLSPTSEYYNHVSKKGYVGPKVEPVKLVDGDNLFNFSDYLQEITYHWLKAHPAIASSLGAYERGLYPPDTQYFVNDEDVEEEIKYNKKKTANDAIIKFDSWSLDKRKKVARLLDLPIGEDTKEQVVYNMVDNFLKAAQVTTGVHKGRDPIKVFALYANLKDDMLYVKDLVEQAFKNQVYKEQRGGRVYEGELEVFKDKDQLIEHLLNEDNQGDLLELEKKLKVKRLARV